MAKKKEPDKPVDPYPEYEVGEFINEEGIYKQ